MFYSEIVLKPVIRIFIAFVFVGYSQEICDSPMWGQEAKIIMSILLACWVPRDWMVTCLQPKDELSSSWSLGWQAGSEIGQSLRGG